ncbi:hypothetical protein C3L33_18732, partial [Rhododendron williamsianum]
MQTNSQSKGILKRRDTEDWMRHCQLPEDLKLRVRRFVQNKRLATQRADEETILSRLPSDLRHDIQRHVRLDLVRRVPFFSEMDDQLLDAIWKRLVSSLSTEGTYIVREGDFVTKMIFIIRGSLESSTTNGDNSVILRAGDFCGEELLAWALLPKSTTNLPSSTRTVARLMNKKLQHTLRYYSPNWRTWAARVVQAAWQRYKWRRLTKGLAAVESSAESGTDKKRNRMVVLNDRVVGEGGFGRVYKGLLDEKNGSGLVFAVKKLNVDTWQGFQEWQDTVGKRMSYSLSRIHAKGQLGYPTFSTGLYCSATSMGIRLNILIGAARGLEFLHTSEVKVIYRDFKTSNILLDEFYCSRDDVYVIEEDARNQNAATDAGLFCA